MSFFDLKKQLESFVGRPTEFFDGGAEYNSATGANAPYEQSRIV